MENKKCGGISLLGGWATPLKYDFVSWDDDIPNWMDSHKVHVPNHQPDYGYDNSTVGKLW